jgi:hypothetical protein
VGAAVQYEGVRLVRMARRPRFTRFWFGWPIDMVFVLMLVAEPVGVANAAGAEVGSPNFGKELNWNRRADIAVSVKVFDHETDGLDAKGTAV